MELSRSEYPSMLSALPPTPAVGVLRERLRKVQALNTEIAEWLQERRKVEELYAQGLSKLARRQLPGESELGIFQPAWARIIESTSQLAVSHQQFSHKIESEVERPLREYTQANREWVGLKSIEGNLASIAKQIDTAEEKADKLKKKGARAQASRVAEAAAAVEKATGDWDSQAPFVFEKLQAVDESRCNHLRDSLTRYHTLEVDQAQRAMQLAEESLTTLLDLNTSDEIRGFVEHSVHGKPKNERQSGGGSRAPSTAAPSGMPSSNPSIVADDSVSVQSAGSGSGGGSGSLSHGLGLRRLGTVLRGRNRNSTIPYLRSGSPVRSSEKLSSREGRHPITPASPRSSDFASASSRNLAVPGSPSVNDSARPTTPKTNGLAPPSNDALQQALAPPTTDEPQKDSEGYTIPPPVIDIGGVPLDEEGVPEQPQSQFKVEIKNDVIQEEEEEADAAIRQVATHLRMQPTVSRKTRGRRDARDVRNTMFFPSDSPAAPSFIPPPTTAPTGASTSSLDLLNNSSPPLTPMKVARPVPGIAPSEASDTQSVRSSRSVTSVTGGTIKHPELHEPGLSSSLVETVSVHFDSGVPTRLIVMGEIALAYNLPPVSESTTTPTPTPPSSELIRLDNFPLLEKVAPNPAFITAVPEKGGEYNVSLANLHKTVVAFKYQVHIDENGVNDFLPMILSPVWRIEPHQASVILNYKVNPNYRHRHWNRIGVEGDGEGEPQGRKPITLRNVVFITGIEGIVPTNCQSKPVGTFARDMGRIAWRIGEIVLDEGTSGKLLARFTLDSNASSAGSSARQAPTEMRWEVIGEEASVAGSKLSLSLWVKEDGEGEAKEPEVEVEVDPFADDVEAVKEDEGKEQKAEGEWKKVPTVRRLANGRYIAT